MSDKKLTPEIIRNMSSNEWEEFRVMSWKRKQEYYDKPTPEWYLKSRESYVEFLVRLNKRKEFVESGGPSKPKTLTQRVEMLAGDDVDTFADE
jgi:hypothetical protein